MSSGRSAASLPPAEARRCGKQDQRPVAEPDRIGQGVAAVDVTRRFSSLKAELEPFATSASAQFLGYASSRLDI
jgi:hypothetical protein